MSTVDCSNRSLSFTTPKKLTLAVSAILLVSGCSNTTRPTTGAPVITNKSPVVTRPSANPAPSTTQPATTNGAPIAFLDEESLDELEDLLEATDMTMVEDNKLAIQKYGDLWSRLRAGYRMDHSKYGYNARIEAQKGWFSSRQDYLNRLTARSSRYLYHTVREAERRNIPTELALLPVIESSYDPSATSNAAAAGLWQFIPSTGRIYGLNQSSTYDGRRDVIESTRAAYDFLTALYNQFGSWELALAAYNAGPGRIQRAIDANAARGLPTDFWSLDLPTETENYVPRFLAVADIVANPSEYGVYLPAIANRQHFRSVPANYGVSLSDVSQVTGVSVDELQKLNPALIVSRIDASGPQRVVIPNDVNINIDAKISALTGYGSSILASNGELPSDPNALAAYAASASVPQQTTSYIPPTTTPTATPSNTSVYNNRAPVITEPPVSSSEVQKINAELKQSNSLPTTSATVTANNTVIQEPPLTAAERDFIAKQIQQQTNVSDVVSPVDGNIKLSAIQTQQSILEAKGEEKKLSYATPSNPQVSNKPKPQGQRTTYTVKRGDTLSSIAAQAGLNWRDIAEWNQIDPNANLLAGSTLYLYNAKPMVNNTASSNANNNTANKPDSYVVQSGDTLIGTASRFGLSTSQLASYNNLSTDAQLLRGQRLWLIPGKVKSSSSNSTATSSSNTSTRPVPNIATDNYTVKSGDTLVGLAREFGTTVDTLAALNGLSNQDMLYTNQRLKVPANTSTKNTTSNTSSGSSTDNSKAYKGATANYTVKSGDTLIGIANKLGVSAEQIASINSFDADARLQRGQTIKLPTSEEKVSLQLKEEAVKYKVKSGDTLTGVAARYGVSINDIAAANGFASNANLISGRTIIIPAKGEVNSSAGTSATSQSSNSATKAISGKKLSNTEAYKVQSGDSLIGLARKYGVAVDDLAATNNLASNAQLLRGQTLQVPKLTMSYTVQSGDSLIGLARKYGVSTKELADMNNIEADAQLQRGQKLTVPNR